MLGTTTRILIVAALVAAVHGGVASMRSGLKPSKVELPNRDFRQLPLRIGQWEGAEIDLKSEDPLLYSRIGANVVVERMYGNDLGQNLAFHCAVFDEYDIGAFHLPTNCYRSQGWQLASEERLELDVGTAKGATAGDADPATVAVSLTTWEREGEMPALVCYWYQLGDHIILSRMDLGGARWKLRGLETWPALVKVLIQLSAPDPEQAQDELKAFAEVVYNWTNELDGPPVSDGLTK